MPVTITVDDRALRRRLEALAGRIERACMRKALRSAATRMMKYEKAATPKLTGAARKSMKVKVKVHAAGGRRGFKGAAAYAVVKYTGLPAFYMRMYERGGRHQRQPSRPFFEPTAEAHKGEVVEIMGAALKEAVERAEGSAAGMGG